MFCEWPTKSRQPSAGGDFNSPREWGKHAATDFPDPRGARDGSVLPGKVVTRAYLGNAGNTVEIDTPVPGGTIRTRHCHLSSFSVNVGDTVVGGQEIGKVGNTSTLVLFDHLHLAIWMSTRALALTVQSDPYLTQGWWAVDPMKLLGTEWGAPPQEDDMTPEQATQLAQVWHALFDSVPNPVGGTARRLDLINVAAQSAHNVDLETDAMIAAFPDLATQFDQIDTALFNIKAEFRNVGFGLSPTDAGPLSIGLAKVVKAAAPSLDEGVLRDLFKKALT